MPITLNREPQYFAECNEDVELIESVEVLDDAGEKLGRIIAFSSKDGADSFIAHRYSDYTASDSYVCFCEELMDFIKNEEEEEDDVDEVPS